MNPFGCTNKQPNSLIELPTDEGIVSQYVEKQDICTNENPMILSNQPANPLLIKKFVQEVLSLETDTKLGREELIKQIEDLASIDEDTKQVILNNMFEDKQAFKKELQKIAPASMALDQALNEVITELELSLETTLDSTLSYDSIMNTASQLKIIHTISDVYKLPPETVDIFIKAHLSRHYINK